MERNWLDVVCLILIIIGAVNWGLIGFFNLDLVSLIFGNMSMITRIIFAVVGIAASIRWYSSGNSVPNKRKTLKNKRTQLILPSKKGPDIQIRAFFMIIKK